MISAFTLPSALGRRRNRGFTIGIALGLMAPLAVLLALSLAPGSGSGNRNDGAIPVDVAEARQAVSSFEEALAPVVDSGAATVVYGMRPGINDIYDQRFDDATLASMAQGWVKAMEATRADFAAIDVPPFLSGAADLYTQAFVAYVDTAKALHAAARTTGDERQQHITTAAEHGTRADHLYNAAKAELEEHRQRLGGVGRAG